MSRCRSNSVRSVKEVERQERRYIYENIKTYFLLLSEIPRQCQQVLLVETCLRVDKALGSEKVILIIRNA
jgi:hypothetical protein